MVVSIIFLIISFEIYNYRCTNPSSLTRPPTPTIGPTCQSPSWWGRRSRRCGYITLQSYNASMCSGFTCDIFFISILYDLCSTSIALLNFGIYFMLRESSLLPLCQMVEASMRPKHGGDGGTKKRAQRVCSLLATLLDRWRSKRHTFHQLCREMIPPCTCWLVAPRMICRLCRTQPDLRAPGHCNTVIIVERVEREINTCRGGRLVTKLSLDLSHMVFICLFLFLVCLERIFLWILS
jgi:hypothetical protein